MLIKLEEASAAGTSEFAGGTHGDENAGEFEGEAAHSRSLKKSRFREQSNAPLNHLSSNNALGRAEHYLIFQGKQIERARTVHLKCSRGIDLKTRL